MIENLILRKFSDQNVRKKICNGKFSSGISDEIFDGKFHRKILDRIFDKFSVVFFMISLVIFFNFLYFKLFYIYC